MIGMPERFNCGACGRSVAFVQTGQTRRGTPHGYYLCSCGERLEIIEGLPAWPDLPHLNGQSKGVPSLAELARRRAVMGQFAEFRRRVVVSGAAQMHERSLLRPSGVVHMRKGALGPVGLSGALRG